jgi:Ca2+-binding RTX toxin-like protein
MATSFNLNRDDLNFLLTQVTIGTDYSQLTNAVDPRGLREVSGSNNNLVGSSVGTPGPFVPGPYTNMGQADQDFLRLSPTSYNPAGPDAAYATLGNSSSGNVADATPRLVSNLVSTMFTTGIYANPAAQEAMADFYGDNAPPALPGTNPDPDVASMPTAGVLGGGRYNAWFVAFGQFFDHGLDFVQKGASGTISIPIPEGDPLYVVGGPNVMQVSRANLANPATDFNPDGSLMTGVDPIYKNNTGLLIDQSQTYGSHESVNALLREYTSTGAPTGRIMTGNTAVLNDGDPGNDAQATGLATWADIKINALRVGIALTDADIHNAPTLRVDPTGKLLFTPDGVGSNWTTASIVIGPQAADDPFMRNADGTVMRTNQDMLIDFNPSISLDLHYITGDGRANENFMLTAVHHVFHEEHNFQLENIKAGILATADPAFIAQWQTGPGVWDGEKLFQAARLITESEYNHIAVDQYVGTLYGALPEFVSYSSDINMSVSLEFSQAVFRLGHSMLTETFKVQDTDAAGNLLPTFSDVPLLQAFLNPTQFADLGPAAITAGMVQTYGNEVDEFITPALQQSLLGQPLDLATINLARGRDVGLPTHNELRQQIYDGLLQSSGGNGAALAPYTSWQDYGDHLRHPGTLVNMIAAYARDGGAFDWGINEARAAYLAGAPGATLDDIRERAQRVVDAARSDYATNPEIVDPDGGAYTLAEHEAAVLFTQGTPAYNPGTGQWDFTGGDQGFWDVDLWIGGLAERPLFDGPLGTTFSYILLDFAQRQQDGDRFYYLFRTPMGTNLGDEIINNHFTDLVQRATGLDHLAGDVFITPDAIFERGLDANGVDLNTNDFFDAATQTITYVDGSEGPASGGHIIIAGNGGHDYLKGGLGDDTIYGDDGDDFIEGSQGNDHLYGGAGNDTIHDDENDDFIRGGDGNDRIFAGGGVLDTVFGDAGDDELHGGDGIDEVLGGEGDDALFGEGDTDVLFGESGNDYLDGGDSVDEMQGQAGNDWLRGGVGDDHLIGGDGNDLLEGGLGPTANDGDRLVGQGTIDFGPPAPDDLGVDIASYEDVDIAIAANLDTANQNGTGPLIDTYTGIDGLVGSRLNDNLTGANTGTTSSNGVNNLLVGGAGNDILTGLGGDDFIAGDSVVVKNDLSVYLGPAAGYTTIANWKGTGENRADFGVNGGLGHFLGDNGVVGAADKAVFSGARNNYAITQNADGTLRVVDNRGIDSTTVGDKVKDVEFFQFSNGTFAVSSLINIAATGAPVIGDLTPTEGQALTINTAPIADGNGLGTFSYQWQSSPNGATWTNIAGATTASFTPDNNPLTSFGDQAGQQLRVVVRFTDGGGNPESVISAPTGPVGVDWDGIPFVNNTFNGTAGDDVADGVSPIVIGGADTLNGNGGNDILNGSGGTDTINGGAGNDSIIGGAGNDVVNGGADSDTIIQTSTNGRDRVDGGTTGASPVDTSVDTYQLNGVTGAEVFRIYTRAAALSGPTAISGLTAGQLNANTEIVITRTTGGAVTAASIIAELDNIEEINVNTLGVTANNSNGGLDGGPTGGDTVQIIGNFGTATNPTTSLNFNTITIDGNAGDGIVDISALTSAHRIVFRSNGGNDTIIGNLRPQDVIELPNGATAADYTSTTDANGVTTMTNGAHTILFTAADGMPRVGDDDEEDNGSAGNDDDNDDTSGNGDDDSDGDGGEGDDADTTGGTGTTAPVTGVVQTGTPQADVLAGTAGDDNIVALAGDDVATGAAGADAISVGEGADFVSGGDGRDTIFAGAGDDQVFGGSQADVIYGDAGADRIFGDGGNDLITAGAGNDAVFGGAGDDLIVAEIGDENDVYFGDDSDGDVGIDTLDMSAATANVTVNLGSGPLWNGAASSSQTGNDTIWGIENVNTGSGNDTITASNAVNVMNGGAGNDTFKFTSASAADGDTILGFEPGDRFDLTAIDANLATTGDQGFTLVSGAAFTAAGQLAVGFETRADGDFTVVQGNIDGNADADFKVEIAGHQNLTTANLGL